MNLTGILVDLPDILRVRLQPAVWKQFFKRFRRIFAIDRPIETLTLSHRFVAIRSAAASPVGERQIDAPPFAAFPTFSDRSCSKQTQSKRPVNPLFHHVLI